MLDCRELKLQRRREKLCCNLRCERKGYNGCVIPNSSRTLDYQLPREL
mgnify:CR=1 FL=1